MLHTALRSVVILGCMLAAATLVAQTRKSETAPKKEHPPRISSKVDAQPVAPLNDQEAHDVSLAAGRILKHVAQAREALHEKKKDDATMHIGQALKLVAIIDRMLPHFRVKTEIKSGELAYSDEDDVIPRYVILFDELERRDIIAPVVQAKKEAQQKQLKSAPSASAAADTPHGLAVSRADVKHSSAKLDIVLARVTLHRAKQDLDGGKPAEADEALFALQSGGVLFELEEAELPLEEAADNLKLAEFEMKQGQFSEAQVALQTAIEQLKRYEKLAGESRGNEVKALHQEIAKLTAELEKGSPTEADQQKHASRIADYWHRATNWFKRSAK